MKEEIFKVLDWIRKYNQILGCEFHLNMHD
jgi:hypothetical protein